MKIKKGEIIMNKLAPFKEEINQLLSEERQIKSKEYLSKLTDIESFAKRVYRKKVEAEKEIPNLKKQIALLNVEQYKELDPEKIKGIEDEKLKLRLKIDDLEGLLKTNIKGIVKQKFIQELDPLHHESHKEFLLFKQTISQEQAKYNQLIDELEQRVTYLNGLKRAHAFNEVEYKKDSILNLSFDMDDDGWVSDKNHLPHATTVYVSEDGSMMINHKEESK